MDRQERLAFSKCFFCCKNFNKLQLTDMNSNTVLINDEEIEYHSLVFDVVMIKMNSNPNYICSDCNDSLLSFHFFKRDVKKYSSFSEHLLKLEILSKVEQYLDQVESLCNLQVYQDANKFTISPAYEVVEEKIVPEDIEEPQTAMFEQQHYTEEFTETIEELENETEQSILDQTIEPLSQYRLDWFNTQVRIGELQRGNQTLYKCSLCFGVFSSASNLVCHLRDVHLLPGTDSETMFEIQQETEDCQDDIELTIAVEQAVEEEFSELQEPEESTRPLKKRKLNTLSELTKDQINWIRAEVVSGELTQGDKRLFKCSTCEVVLSSQASLTRHLRDVHLMKNEKSDQHIVKEEIKRSLLEIDTSKGTETVWKCNRCENDRIYKSEQAFKLHLRMTHIRATKIDTAFITACKTIVTEFGKARDVWKCPDCQRVFRHRDSLRHHIKLVHQDMAENNDEAKLTVSPEATSRAALARIAQKLEHKQVGKSMAFCNECGLKFLTAKHHMKPKVHRESHETFKILAPHLPCHKCESCRMIFNSETTLNDHLAIHDVPENVHTTPADGLAHYGACFYKVSTGDADDAIDEGVWKCAHCPVRYFEEKDCVTHIMLLHSSPITCFIDNREFSGSSGMSKYVQHMKNKHSELFPDMKFPCGICKSEFTTIYEKLAHQRVCSIKKFQCDYCGKRFLTKHQLQAHILYELGLTGFSCEFCAKRCKTLSDLKIHQNVHSMNRPYICSLCPKTFKTPGARSNHMEGHNSDGFPCDICGLKLASRTLYKRHVRFQHNQDFRESQLEKNSCNLCHKSFVRSSHYKSHMKMHQVKGS